MLCNDDVPAAENYVKGCSKKCQIYKKNVERNSGAQPYYFSKTVNHNPCFLCFYGGDFLLLDIPTTADVPRLGKNSRAHAKLCTLKQFLKRSWYYNMLCLTSINTI